VLPIIIGCVDYRFTSGPEHHQTGFIYTLIRGHKGVEGGFILNANEPSVPADELGFDQTVNGGIRTD
jgi:hypothetical protein